MRILQQFTLTERSNNAKESSHEIFNNDRKSLCLEEDEFIELRDAHLNLE